LIEEFLDGMPEEAWDEMQLVASSCPVLLQAHCHQTALAGTAPMRRVLCRLPGIDLREIDAGCCGMAGSFGYEVEHYEVSRACAERALVPAIRAADSSTEILAPGFSCRHQIEHFTGRPARHPIALVADRLPSE
jgi:Fe-S oxidoreductase